MAVIPVYNNLVLSNTNVYLKTDTFEKAAGHVPQADERTVIIVLRNEEPLSAVTEGSFYPIGVSGFVSEIHDEGWLAVRSTKRVNIDEVSVSPGGHIEVVTSPREDTDILNSHDDAQKAAGIKSALIELSEGTQWEPVSRAWVNQFSTLNEIASACSIWMDASNEERYAILAEDSAVRRAEMLEKLLYETLEIGKLSQEGTSARQEDYQRMVRESAIRKQMEYLQKELDEMHPENVSDIRRLELKIQESGMNDTARQEATKLLNRLKQEGTNGTETGMLYNYLDFLTSLSWKKEPAKTNDLDEAEHILEEDHFGLAKVKNRILQQIAVMNLKKEQSGSILLFVGAPGTGKTSIGQSIARALKRKYVRVSLGGIRDEADIRGHRRTYIGAMPGRIMDAIQKSGVSNPVMVLDEVDKLSTSYNGDPASALLEVLDPEQNSTFTDHYMNVPYDLSDVLFICTANTVDTIPEPLLNRMEVIQFQGYTPIEKLQISIRHLLPKTMEAVGITDKQLQVQEDAIRLIISDYTREGGVRGLKKRLESLCRAAAVSIARGKNDTLIITPANVREYLDMHPMRHRNVKENAVPGIITGLAWTAAGGEILYIEALLTKGNGQVIITGQLGDVMKESVRLAISLVKRRFPDKTEAFQENDLHIHVPDGATPKDGPSAGITLITAIASLITDKAIDPYIAMTGEISLRGEVTAIGGLPEKLMAAQRAGVRQVLIPAENVEDLEDVPQETRNSLQIIPVENMDDVLSLCGLTNGKGGNHP